MFDAVVLFLLVGSFSFLSPRADCDELWSLYGLGLVAILSFFLKKKREIEFKWLGVFLVTALAGLAFKIGQPMRMSFANLFIACFALKTIAEHSSFTVLRFGWFLLGVNLCTLAIIGWQLIGRDPIYFPLSGQVSGTFIMPWAMGCFAAMSVPFLFAVSPWACLLTLPALYYSHSSICVVVAAVSFILMFPKHSRLMFLIALLVVLSYVCFVDKGVDIARFKVMQGSILFLKSWLHGNTIGSWAHEGFARNNGATVEYWRFAHNEPFQVFFEMGAAGLGVAICFIVRLFGKQKRVIVSALAGIILLSLFHSIFHYGRLAFFAVVVLAIACRESGREPVSPVCSSTTSTQ